MASDTFFRWKFRALAFLTTLGSLALTLQFGLVQSDDRVIAYAIAGVLCCFSLGSDYVWIFVVRAWRARQFAMSGALALGALLMLSLNLMSNLGSVGWQRETTALDSQTRKVRADAAAAQLGASSDRLAMLEGLLAEVDRSAPWAAQTTADALRGQIAAKKADVERERNDRGCKAKCKVLLGELEALEAQRGKVEARATYADEARRLRAAITKERARAVETNGEQTVAAPIAQAAFFASLVERNLEPTENGQAWTRRGITGWMAVGMTFGPIVLGLIGFCMFGASEAPRRAPGARDSAQPPAPAAEATPLVPAAPASGVTPAGRTLIVHRQMTDARFARAAANRLAQYRAEREAIAA